MESVLIRAGCFVAIIFLGTLLRRVGFFKESDFLILSGISLRVTLPAAIVTSFTENTQILPFCLCCCRACCKKNGAVLK